MNVLKSEKELLDFLQRKHEEKILSEKYYHILKNFYIEYKNAVLPFHDPSVVLPIFSTLFLLIIEQIQNPYQFEPYHEKIENPFDYHAFGLSFLRPLIDWKDSTIQGLKNVEKMIGQISKKENVILFANHQTEVDPQIIDALLEKHHPKFGSDIIFVAGERVILDPNAIPFSMGRNLLCIYSKKYIDNPPENKREKQLHNSRTMKLMSSLLNEGGKAIYVAPSGGRDRKNPDGAIFPAPFDSQSIEMFYLMAKRAKTPTHFYPLTLATYDLMPPPSNIQKELGEFRQANHTDVHIHFGEEIDMEHFPGHQDKDRRVKRKKRTEYIYNFIQLAYKQIAS